MASNQFGGIKIKVPKSQQRKKRLAVRIYYEMRRPVGAMYFVNCDFPDEESKEMCRRNGYRSNTAGGERFSHMFTYTSLCGGDQVGSCCGAQCWFPCMDSLGDRTAFAVEVTIPLELKAVSVGDLVSITKEPDNLRKTVRYEHREYIALYNVSLAVGPFVETRLQKAPFFDASQPQLTEPNTEITVSFYSLPDKADLAAKAIEHSSSIFDKYYTFLGFPFPFKSYKQVFIEADGAYVKAAPYSTLAILSDEVLVVEDFREAINVPLAEHLRVLMAQCIAYNYIGSYLNIHRAADVWLVPGFCWFISYIYLNEVFEEESTGSKFVNMGVRMKYDSKELLEYCLDRIMVAAERDKNVSEQRGKAGDVLFRNLTRHWPPLYPVDATLWEGKGVELDCLLAYKAFLVMHILDTKTRRSNAIRDVLRAWLNRTRKRSTNQSGNKSVPGGGKKAAPIGMEAFLISEEDFFARMKNIGANTSDNTLNYWLKSNRILHLRGSVSYDKRNNTIHVVVKQNFIEGVKPFQGVLTIRVIEGDGHCNEYEKIIQNREHHWSFAVQSKPKKKQGGRKTKQEDQRIKNWDHPEKLEASKLLNLVTKKPQSNKKKGEVKEDRWWTNHTPVRYVLVDPDVCWIRHMEWRQNVIMALEFLNDDRMEREIVAQRFVLQQLGIPISRTKDLLIKQKMTARARLPNASPDANGNADEEDVSNMEGDAATLGAALRAACAIAACIVDFSRPAAVREGAIIALAEWQNGHAPLKANDSDTAEAEQWKGLSLLLSALTRLFCSETTGKLLPNDFDVSGELVVKCAAVRALAMIKAKNGVPPIQSLDFILTLLHDNDNSVNRFDDSTYIGELVVSAATIVANTVSNSRKQDKQDSEKHENIHGYQERSVSEILTDKYTPIVSHIRRYLDYDSLKKSPRNIITARCLEAFGILQLGGVIEKSKAPPYYAYAVHVPGGDDSTKSPSINAISAVDWGMVVRESAFKAIILVYVRGHFVREEKWFGVLKWLLDALAAERSPRLKFNIFNHLLEVHADTINDTFEELHGHSSKSGVLYPLSHTYDDLMKSNQGGVARDVASKLWFLMNEAFAYDGRLRMVTHQLWRSIWGLETPPVLSDIQEAVNNGPYAKWDKAWETVSEDEGEEEIISDRENEPEYDPTWKPPSNSKRKVSPSNGGVKKLKIVLKRN